MVGGVAYAGGKARQRSQSQEAEQEQRLASLEQQQAPAAPASAAPAAAPATDIASKLTELKGLQDSGALTPEEFETAKQKLLQG